MQYLLWSKAHVNITGGHVISGDDGDPFALRLNDEATADISDGSVVGSMGHAIKVMGNGYVAISGGMVGSDIVIEDSGVVEVFGGTLSLGTSQDAYLRAYDDSVANVYGGAFYRESPNPPNADVRYKIEGHDQATVNIFGTDFSTEPYFENRFRLRGRLADGNELDVIICGNVVLHEVPEPSTLLLAILGLICFVRRRHREGQGR